MSRLDEYDAPFTVNPDPDLEDLVPGYIEHREADAKAIAEALEAGDLAAVQFIGHSMKGSGSGYGFDGLTDIGLELENAGRDADEAAAAAALHRLTAYLRNMEIVYE